MQQWVVLREEEQDSERVCYTVNIFSILFHSRGKEERRERGGGKVRKCVTERGRHHRYMASFG